MQPKPISTSSIKGFTKQVLWNLLLMAVGSTICAVAVKGILLPQQFFGAGVTGVALVIHYLFPPFPMSAIYLTLNIPIFALGWFYVGRRFFFYSIGGMLFFSGALQWINVLVPVHDKILSAILAGIITGLGAGITLRSLGSGGGLDILSVILLKRFSVRLGTTMLSMNSLVLLVGAILFSLDAALYTLIFIFVSSYIINLVVMGLSQRKAVMIISPQWERISREIVTLVHRGLTIVKGKGGYSGQEVQIIYTVVAFQELPRLKRLIRSIDPNVFMVVSGTLEVMGVRIGNQPQW
ncbi:MAG: YitT family protein [Deltaproteobacteria bacterium]|nr:YitT family protein [Deltaproteobacteria bacterium]